MGLRRYYEGRLLPAAMDVGMRAPVIAEQRELLVPRARGTVLEVGIGSGLNLRYYDGAQVERLYGLDPSAELERWARRRAAAAAFPVEIVEGSAEAIPAADGVFDTVVSTFTLCSIGDLPAALREMRRVLKPDGRFLFCEHGLSPDSAVAGWQQRLTPAWRRVAGGCHLNRPMAALIQGAGFAVAELAQEYLPGPRVAAYVYRGVCNRVVDT